MTDDETKFRKANEDALRAWLRSSAGPAARGTLSRIAATDGWNTGVEWLLKMVTGSEDPWAYMRAGTESETTQAGPQPYCHGAKDGECYWEGCPQDRDGEPTKSGRHCPLDLSSCPSCDDYMRIGDDDLWHCTGCEETHEPTEATKAAVAAERARFKVGTGCENCRNPSMPYGICHRCGRKWGICAEANKAQDLLATYQDAVIARASAVRNAEIPFDRLLTPAEQLETEVYKHEISARRAVYDAIMNAPAASKAKPPAAMQMPGLLGGLRAEVGDLQKRVIVLESKHERPCGCGRKAKK